MGRTRIIGRLTVAVGLAAGTVLAITFVPVFFLVVLRLFRTRRKTETPAETKTPAALPAAGE